jgi:hypothetical protein
MGHWAILKRVCLNAGGSLRQAATLLFLGCAKETHSRLRPRKKIRYYSGGKRQGSVEVPHAQCPYIKKFIIRDCNQHYPICPSYFDNIQLVTCITLLTTINP